MKVVILCKRRPQQKDLWERPYGRFYGLAKGLADSGHDVHLVLLNYRAENEFEENRDGITWHSVNLRPNPLRYYFFTKALLVRGKTDWVIGFSDTYFGICADLLGRQTGVKVLIDAYDNYESYLSWCRPLHWLWQRALKHSTAITAAGPGLLDYMGSGRTSGNAAVIEMAADDNFTPGSKQQARKILGLPLESPTVAYSGSLYRSRGIEELFELIERTAQLHTGISWVLSGRLETGIQLPDNCHHLGYVDDDQVVEVLRSADLAVCVNRPGDFGDYSYPVKIYEALATGIPVIAFRTDSVEYVMRDHTDALVDFGDTQAMAVKICQALDVPPRLTAQTPGWSASSIALQEHLQSWRNNSG